MDGLVVIKREQHRGLGATDSDVECNAETGSMSSLPLLFWKTVKPFSGELQVCFLTSGYTLLGVELAPQV